MAPKTAALVFALSLFAGCDSETGGTKRSNGNKNNANSQATAFPTYSQASAIVLRSCAGSTCHSGLAPGRQLLISQQGLDSNAANAKMRLQNQSMPPVSSTISASDRQTLINYLQNLGAGPGGTGAVTYLTVAPIVSRGCAGATCHDGQNQQRVLLTTQTGLDTNASSAFSQLSAGTMPKVTGMATTTAPLTAQEKQTLLQYLQQVKTQNGI